jgi:VWFA-related protein
MKAGRLLLAAVLATHVAAAAAQQVPGTFRSTVTLVPVDVRVLDRNGKPVTDLTARDFTLLEDGVSQEIRHFSSQLLTADAQLSPIEAQRDAAATPVGLPPQKQRIFLIMLGRGRLQYPSKGVDAMIRFVRERLLPQDRVAVMAYNRATDFTTEHERVAQMLDRFRAGHERVEARLVHRAEGLEGILGYHGIPEQVQHDIDAMFAGPGDLAYRTVPPGRITDAGRIAEDQRNVGTALLSGDISSPRERGTADQSLEEYALSNIQTMSDLENLYTGIEYLRYLEGEKHLVYLTERGLFLPRMEDDTSLAAMANDARVVLDTIHTGGVSGGPRPTATGPMPMPGPTFTESFAVYTLRTMSDLTGGIASLYSYADEAAQQIDQGSRFQYLLGYSPATANWNGQYRKISVKVNRPGVTVSYRRGYYARQQLVPFDRQNFLTYSRTLAAALYPQDIRDIKVKLKASPVRNDDGSWAVASEITIDISRLTLEMKDGERQLSLDIALFCSGYEGKGLGELWRKFKLSLNEEAYKKALKDGVSYSMRIPATNRAIHAKVVVYDYAGDLVGTAETRM